MMAISHSFVVEEPPPWLLVRLIGALPEGLISDALLAVVAASNTSSRQRWFGQGSDLAMGLDAGLMLRKP